MTDCVWDVYSDTDLVYTSVAAEAGQAVDEALQLGVVLTGVQRRTIATGELGPMIAVVPVVAAGQGDA